MDLRDQSFCVEKIQCFESLNESSSVGSRSEPRLSPTKKLRSVMETKSRPPLNLPHGSVRAILTLLVVLVIIVDVMREQSVALVWTETLMIVLAHYFTSRRFIQLPPDVIQRLEEEGHIERESNPLYLPRHSIRGIIVLAFVGLAIYLFRNDLLLKDPNAIPILVTVFSYLLGAVGRLLWSRWRQSRPSARRATWWDDLKAIVVLIVLGTTAIAHLTNCEHLLPHAMKLAALGLVLFYFGSR